MGWNDAKQVGNGAVQKYTNNSTFGFSNPNPGDYTNKNNPVGANAFGMDTGIDAGTFGDMNLSQGLDLFGKGMGIFGDFMSYQNQKKGMEAAITGMNNTTKGNNYNMENKTNFLNSASNAFGQGTASGPQTHATNQFGTMVS